MKRKPLLFLALAAFLIMSCGPTVEQTETTDADAPTARETAELIQPNPDKYVPFRLTADLNGLSAN